MDTDFKNPGEQEYEQLNPLFAAVKGRDEEDRWLTFASFSMLSDESREILTSPQTVDLIKQWSGSGLFPSTHAVAVSKLIGLAGLNEVPTSEIAPLLEKLSIPRENALKIATAITELLAPILTERALDELPEMSAVEMPPMTRPMESGPKPLITKVPGRNIIDLRKPPTTT